MALSREKKEAILTEITELLADSKMVVMADYTGLGVAELQALRASASEQGVQIRVVKNRLFAKAVSQHDSYKDVDLSSVTGQVIYAVSNEDEVAPAQVLHNFAKDHTSLEFVAGLNAQAELLDKDAVKQLATLPSKDQLRGQLVGTLAAPLSGLASVLSGNLRGLVNVLNAQKDALESN